jgi:hypothetical protein
MKHYFYFIIFSITLFFGCYNIEENVYSENDNEVVKRTDNCTPENSVNVFDSIGQLHNLFVYDVESNCTQTSTQNDVMDVMEDIVSESFGISYIQYIQNFSTTQSILNQIDHDSISYYLNTLNLSVFEKNEILTLFTIIDDYDGTNLCDLINDIKSFESDLINAYNTNSIKKILYATSVARHSLYYWDADLNDQVIQLRWPLKKWIIAGADILGAVAGALTENPYVAVTWSGTASVAAAKIYDELAAK